MKFLMLVGILIFLTGCTTTATHEHAEEKATASESNFLTPGVLFGPKF